MPLTIAVSGGIFYRDIKLENLLVNPDTWEVKLINFGCGTLMKDSANMAFNGMFDDLLEGCLIHWDTSCCINIKILSL